MTDEVMIDIQHLTKKFGKHTILKDINGTVKKGQVICIIGPSGAGKSTFLRCLNHLETPTDGTVVFEGKKMEGLSEKEIQKIREKMGMVFQSYGDGFPKLQPLPEQNGTAKCQTGS